MKRFLIVALSVLALLATQTGLLAQATPGTQGTAGAQEKTKTMNATGTVKSVTGDSLVVTTGSTDMTFTVDGTTKFVGKGLGTKSAGGKLTATDAVAANDKVRVAYHDMAGTKHAATVTITAKGSAAPPKK